MVIDSVLRAVLTCVVLSAVAGGALADDDTEVELLRGGVERIAEGMKPRIGRAAIASAHVIPRLYERRSFRLAWTNPGNIDELVELIENSHAEGLDPEDYHLSTLRSLIAEARRSDSPGLRATLRPLLAVTPRRTGSRLAFRPSCSPRSYRY